jgi:hypothetical protein
MEADPRGLYGHGRTAWHHLLGYHIEHSLSRTFFAVRGWPSLIHGWDAGASLKWSPAGHRVSVERDPKVPFLNPSKEVRYGSVIGLECGSLLPLCPAQRDQLAGRAPVRGAGQVRPRASSQDESGSASTDGPRSRAAAARRASVASVAGRA